MRPPRFLPLLTLLLPIACTSPTHVVATADDAEVSPAQMAADLASADVVVLGEVHGSSAVHQAHRDLLERLHERRGDVVIAMQMFERDVQPALQQYLNGQVGESDFLAAARPWPNYTRDYRPIIEFARSMRLPVLAANAPEASSSAVLTGGLAAVAGDPHCARSVSAPEDDYFESFVAAMGGPGDTPESLRLHYEAQCLSDDTMAETISDYLGERARAGARPLVVLFCGCLHSDHGRGVVARIKNRLPGRDVRVLSTELVADIEQPLYSASRSLAQYVIVAPGGSEFGAASIAAAPTSGASSEAGYLAGGAAASEVAAQEAAAAALATEREAREAVAREALAAEQAARQAADRKAAEVAAREVAAREAAALEAAAVAVREATTKKAAEIAAREAAAQRAVEAAAREAAAREAAARETAELFAREQAAREQAARELAAREQAAREQAAREQAARELAARQKAERDAAAAAAAATANVSTTPAPTRRQSPAPRPAPTPVSDSLRPALGLQPDYAGAQQGVLVGAVREGGAAEKAGVLVGDIIVMLGDLPVVDVESYMAALEAQAIGQSVPLRVRRNTAEVELQVVVGARPGRAPL